MSSQCEECGTQNIDDLNEEYNWCNSCLKNFNFLNFEVFINRSSDEKNEKIDDVIQEMQSKIKGPSDIIFEWIPYNQFNNISEEGKGDSAKACSAIWKDGPLTYSYFKKKLVRVSNKKIVLKYLFNSKDIKFLDEVKMYSINYSKNIYIYGISQDPSTKDYIIALNAKALKKQIDDFNAEKKQKLEELIKEKIKDFEFNYFEYSKFSNLKGIGGIGEGFDMVKKAKTDNGIKVVLKAFINENSKIENFISNFMKELELLHMVGYHDNINRFLGITKDDIGNYFTVLKHANEGNLRDYLVKKFDSLQWENKIQMAFDITCGLKYLHSKGIIHRHLHSNNILANNDRLLISDFGLSNLMGNKTGIVEYIDPQCFKDIKYVRNEKSDIYSLGVLLWEITSGRPPFHNNNVLQDDMKRSNLQNYTGHMSFREEQIEGTPLEFRRLYEKCLDVDPEKRPDINQVYKEILNQSDDLYEEEWIKKKMKEEDICYFEYSKFSNFEEIGKGGFGVVKKAMTDDGNKVALKGLIENSKIGRNVIKTFVKELKNLRMVSHHDNINKFLGISKDHTGNYIMVLGYANEGNLRSYLKVKFDSLEWGDKIRMALDITCGLKCLHSKKIIHRDLHSKNILVNNGRLLIADFGLSKHLTDATSNSTGNRTGITEYIDPRCFRDFKYVRREKSDIYSLGILLWEITSGRPPFHDDNVSQAQDDSEQSTLRYHIGHLNLREKPIDGTPLEYQQLYQKCWDGDPEKRPDVNQVYNEILCQYNADDIHEKHEDFSSSNSHDNLNISSDYSEPYLGSEFD